MSRTTEHLESKGIAFETIPHAQAFTSAEEARAVGVTPHTVIKALLLDTKWGRALAVIAGDRRLDMKLVQDAVGDHHVHMATEEEIRRDYPDFELGCLPPLGTLLGLPMYVDGEVMRHDEVVFAAGSQTEAVRARPVDLFDHEHVTVTRLASEPADQYV
jgi:Ala-tRNA(Pro) deacylase